MNSTIRTQLVDGRALAKSLRESIELEVSRLSYIPTLAVVLVGDDPASQVYVRNKIKLTESVGMQSVHHRLSPNTDQNQLESLVDDLSADPGVDGILVQLPLPTGLDEASVLSKISPDKDVDGLTVPSIGRLSAGLPGLRPCTPLGCVHLAKSVCGADLSGLNVVVVGRSILVGKPVAALFLAENCTVTIAHSKTKNLQSVCATADILVAAVGRAEMVKGDWLKPGAIVIDVGINRVDDPDTENARSKLVGDVDQKSCIGHVAALTPVPGGVGPMTIAYLLKNTLDAAKQRRKEVHPAPQS